MLSGRERFAERCKPVNFNAAPAGRIAPTRVDDYFRESLRRRRSRLCGLFGSLAAIGFREEALGDDTAQRTSGREKTRENGSRENGSGEKKEHTPVETGLGEEDTTHANQTI